MGGFKKKKKKGSQVVIKVKKRFDLMADNPQTHLMLLHSLSTEQQKASGRFMRLVKAIWTTALRLVLFARGTTG